MPPPAAATDRGHSDLRGFVVAGGRSSRMGRDKALLPFRGATLVEHAVATARQVAPDVRILCGPDRRYEDFGAPVIEDQVCGVGAIGGLHAALLSASIDGRKRIFWLAVDLPLVGPPLLTSLVAGLDDSDVVMARTDRGLEPLCAAFRTEPALVCVRRALLAGRLKLTSALEGLTLQAVDASSADFINVNTAAEYEHLSSR